MDLYFQNNNNNLYNYQTINKLSPTIYNNSNAIIDSFPENFQNSTIDNSYHNNIFNMSNTYHNINKKKFVNNNNINLRNNNNKDQLNDISNLNFKIIESTTEDLEHPLRELLKGLKGVGWFSSRFSQFP